jgi:hypothetical protein
MKVSDYFAEMYVAGRFADGGWNIYFPHRDVGFDFIAAKQVNGQMLIRPVQVKGKYPSDEKGDQAVYGYVGKLTATHPDMVLAIPYFSNANPEIPVRTAYMPLSQIRRHVRGFRCQPASYKNGGPAWKLSFEEYFDDEGLRALESPNWGLERRVA